MRVRIARAHRSVLPWHMQPAMRPVVAESRNEDKMYDDGAGHPIKINFVHCLKEAEETPREYVIKKT